MRSANVRAHKEKGWFRDVAPDVLLTGVYDALFARNPKVNPEDVEAVFCGTAKQMGPTFDLGRLAWLAGGYPEKVASNTICQQCPSGMSALESAARAIMCGEGDIYIAAGVEDMLHVPMAGGVEYPPRLLQRYDRNSLGMGSTAEKVAEMWKVS
jgi:acetyl-CoA acetyltransferase